MKNNDFELLQDYLDDLLGLTQKKELEDRLQNEPLLRQELQKLKQVHKIVEVEEELEILDMMQAVDAEKEKAENEPTKGRKFNKYWLIAVALAGLLILFFTLLKQTSDVDKTYIAQGFSLDNESIVARGIVDDSQDSVVQFHYIQPIVKVNEFILKGEFDEARKGLDLITAEFPLAVQNKEYTLGLIAYLQNGRRDPEFHRILNKILDDPKHNCYRLAVRLDSEVNSIWGRIKG